MNNSFRVKLIHDPDSAVVEEVKETIKAINKESHIIVVGGGAKSPEERKAMLEALTPNERDEFLKDQGILERIKKSYDPAPKKTYSLQETMAMFGITQKDLDETPEPQLEY